VNNSADTYTHRYTIIPIIHYVPAQATTRVCDAACIHYTNAAAAYIMLINAKSV